MKRAVLEHSEKSRRLNIVTSVCAEGCVVSVSGRIDSAGSIQLRRGLGAVLGGAPRVVLLDLRKLQHIASAGIATLVEFRQELAERGGTLRFVGANFRIRALFEVLSPHQPFGFFPDEASAIRGEPRAGNP